MNKDQFWQTIETVNQAFPNQERTARLYRLEENLLDRLDTCTLAPETRKTILEELPQRPDIVEDWQLWMLPELFPNICKTREPKKIKKLLATGNIGLEEPTDKEIENKLTPFFSIFLDNGFSSEHYGTKLNDGYEWNLENP
ncbi:hypothetical protein AALA83_16120 [Oscillospiraceae bacterium 44-5]